MRNLLLPAIVLAALSLSAQVRGNYVESRTADVYTGQCFANGEVNLAGNEAIMAWQIERGTWNGVTLDGMAAAAVVRAKATLGDPYANPYPAQAVLILDDRATPAQQQALAAFVRHQGGELLSNIVRTERQPVLIEVASAGRARVQAGNTAAIATRAVNGHDHICGNEFTYYQPLTPVRSAQPAVALTDRYQGADLGDTWELHGKRSAFVGTFDTAAPSKEVQDHHHAGD